MKNRVGIKGAALRDSRRANCSKKILLLILKPFLGIANVTQGRLEGDSMLCRIHVSAALEMINEIHVHNIHFNTYVYHYTIKCMF